MSTDNSFSKAFQKYYTRKGNRIIFSNGMSLNHLAWEMWERLVYQEIDPSVLSRVISGERLFTKGQLEIFCQILKINNQKKNELRDALFVDWCTRFGIKGFSSHHKKQEIELLRYNLRGIKASRRLDLTPLEGDWIVDLRSYIAEKINSPFYPTERERLIELYTETLVENEYYYKVALPYKEGFRRVLKLTNMIRELAQELRNTSYLAVYYHARGGEYFLTGRYKKALDYLPQAVEIIDAKALEMAGGLPPLRLLLLSYSYLGMQNEYEKTRDILLSDVGEKNPEIQVFVYEGLTLAAANLGRIKESELFLKKGYESYNLIKKYGNYEKLSKIVLIKAELESGKALGDKDIMHLEKIGNEALQIAKAQGYGALVKPINKALGDILQ